MARGPEAGVPSVHVYEGRGTRIALDHLRSLGRERIALVGNLEHAGVRERLAAYERYVEEHSLHTEEGYAKACPSRRSAAAVAQDLLKSSKAPTALFCASDLLAFGALGAAWRAGLPVPGRVSVVGFDDVEEAADFFTPLTTVRQPVGRMAEAAVRMLRRQIEGVSHGGLRDLSMTPQELVVRASSGPPA